MTDTTDILLADIRAELRGMRAEVQAQRNELHGLLQGVRSEVRDDFHRLLQRQVYRILAAFAALLATLAHGFHWI